MARFFIDRPVLAMVVSIVITLAGAVAIVALPIAQYPDVVPPQVQITATYLGANALDVEKTVTQPIEQQLTSLDNMLYLDSTSSNDGTVTINATFEVGTDVDLATVKVQNKEAVAAPVLPPEVTQLGVVVKKKATAFLLAITFTSPDGRYDDLFLSNFVKINLVDQIASLPGVGDTKLTGEREYSMRVWLNPDKLSKLGLTTSDIKRVVQQENRQNPAGQIGQPPGGRGIDFQYNVNAPGRLLTPEQFESIVVHAEPDGSLLRLKDVARIELGARDYRLFSRVDGKPSASLVVYQAPGANAVATAKAVEKFVAEAATRFPPGIEYTIPYNTTRFVLASIREVLSTLRDAILLVLLVVFVFLQNWRATLIPLLTVPVALVGTFAAFVAFGFSINMTTLFGLVLAIGIVVDDAIVVVEAVQHNLDTTDMSPREAAIAAMNEVSGPVVAIAFILSAVFVPISLLGGITGQLYRNFALTIAVAVLISAVCALTLAPALSALLLRKTTRTGGPLGLFYRGFNRVFDAFTAGYLGVVRVLVRHTAPALLALLLVCVAVYGIFKVIPTGFLPDEDQGAIFVLVRLPDAASLERTDAVVSRLEATLSKIPGVNHVIAWGGIDLITGTNTTNVATLIMNLAPWDERKAPELHLDHILARVQPQLARMPEAIAFAFGLPPILGLSNQAGFEFQLLDKAGGEVTDLAKAAEAIVGAARQRPEIVNVNSTFRVAVPQLKIDVDRDKARTLGIPTTDVYEALQTYLGSLYVNDFNRYGRTWKVYLQAEADYRREPSDIGRFYVRTGDGQMAPLSTLVTLAPSSGPDAVYHFDRFRTAKLTGLAAPGYSIGQAVAAMEQVARATMPAGYDFAWTGTVFQQKRSEGQEPVVFGLSSVVVLLLLAALYESWALPFAVILAVPLGLFGALLAELLRGYPYDVYTQIGIVTLIGLAAKNAILIVEFAKLRHEEGQPIEAAALQAAQLRLRPILMTSFAFILGVVPLVIASGAGAGSRRALGTAVFGGMNAATLLAIFIVPTLYVVISGLAEGRRGTRRVAPLAPAHEQTSGGDS